MPTPRISFVEGEQVVYCKKRVVSHTITLDIPTIINDRIPL